VEDEGDDGSLRQEDKRYLRCWWKLWWIIGSHAKNIRGKEILSGRPNEILLLPSFHERALPKSLSRIQNLFRICLKM
jgi:hypothetical protein